MEASKNDRKEKRPNQKSLIAWEIYYKSVLGEHDTIIALKELEKKGKIRHFWKGETIWWELNE